MIIDYGTSHDAGVAVVDEQSGRPLFAASLERLTRYKSAPGSPLLLREWLDRQTKNDLSASVLLPLSDDQIYRPELGWFDYVTAHAMARRWSLPEATLEISPDEGFTGLHLGLVPFWVTLHRFSADVFINGQKGGTVSNHKEVWKIRAPADAGPVGTVTFRSSAPLHLPPDPRSLGVLFHSIALTRKPRANCSRTRRQRRHFV